MLPQLSPVPAERPVYMSKTSDAFGLFHHKDVDSYMKTIVRKLNEKCATSADFLKFVRSVKRTDTKSITPTELRYILVKFGVTLPQEVVDVVFGVFDDDRSGSVDLDEFISMMMKDSTSSFKKKRRNKISDEEILRKKLVTSMIENASIFGAMKIRVSYLELISLSERIGLSERDIRFLSKILDPSQRGFIESAVLRQWAKTGCTDFSKPDNSTSKVSDDAKSDRGSIESISLQQCINSITGRNPEILLKCFAHVRNSGLVVKMGLEELKQALLSEGIGKGVGAESAYRCQKQLKQLFALLGGDSGLADIHVLIRTVKEMVETVSLGPAKNLKEPQKIGDFKFSSRNADDRLRSYLKVGFKQLKKAMDHVAVSSTRPGFIEAEKLRQAISTYCVPIPFTDFRMLLSNLIVTDDNFVDWKHFVDAYDPWKYVTPPETQFDQSEALNRIGSVSMVYLKKKKHYKRKGYQSSEKGTESDNMSVGSDTGSMTSTGSHRKWDIKPSRRPVDETSKVISGIKHPSTITNVRLAPVQYSPTSPNKLIPLREDYPHELVAKMPSMTLPHVPPEQTKPRETHARTDFAYNRDSSLQGKNIIPYWKTASQLKAELLENGTMLPSTTLAPSTASTLGSTFSTTESDRNAILKKYDTKVINICKRCSENLQPKWPVVRKEFKSAQCANGRVKAAAFVAIMENAGLRVNSKDMAELIWTFGCRDDDTVKFDNFLRLCLVA